ncbi:hypothetical protein ACPWT1_16360 [Ramlibacter sp. MMS24-I3-19]|uniref:hypothetical protein n=1 Tax=Ramlibacter sp. MMS24-I3-19 TaxID=3416606 RepID=UPI003D06469C
MDFELVRLGVAFLHLMTCCVAIGLVVLSDFDMVRRLVLGDSASLDETHLASLQQTLKRALMLLWLTGSGLVAIDVWTRGSQVLLNPALQSKFAIVALLTLNGVVLHRTVLPMLKRAGALMRLRFSERTLAVFTGAVSGVSWAYAAMLGIGRSLDARYSLAQILAGYPVLVAGCFLAMVVLTAWTQIRARGRRRGFRNAPMHPLLARVPVQQPQRRSR